MDYRTTTTFKTKADPARKQTTALAAGLDGAPIVTTDPQTATIERTVTAATVQAALADAIDTARAALADFGLVDFVDEPVSATIAEADWHLGEIATPDMPGIVQITDIAGILGVTQQRASQLADTPEFPVPINPGGRRRVWDEAAVRAYAATRRKRPGRPRTTPAA